MSSKSAIAWIALFVLLVFTASRAFDDSGEPSGKSLIATVTRVVDGDTVVVRLGDGSGQRLRYIGVDTPETVKPGEPVQCFGKAASAYNHALVEGKQVRLEVGRERYDRYKRLLAYVYLPGKPETFVNASLVEKGYARTLAIPPNTKFAPRFAELQRKARARGSGLWQAC